MPEAVEMGEGVKKPGKEMFLEVCAFAMFLVF